jgi:(2Fe-2S) ferredoxin
MAQPVWIHEATSPDEAEAACERLRAAGIKCNHLVFPSLTKPRMFGLTPDRWYVFVDPADAERGVAVLAAQGDPPPRS